MLGSAVLEMGQRRRALKSEKSRTFVFGGGGHGERCDTGFGNKFVLIYLWKLEASHGQDIGERN
jgi:hypothetical protein